LNYKHAIIVGASSGLGRELALQLAQAGCRTAILAPDIEQLQAVASLKPGLLLPFAHDVRQYDTVPALFLEITKQLGGLDLIIYCSGVMPDVGPAEFNFEKDRAMIEINVLGGIAWLNQAAIRFQETKSGTIIGIGSVAGDRGRCGQPGYNTSKAALATYLEALRNRLSKLGVHVVTVKPGPMQTPMTQHLHLKGAMQPDAVARKILSKAHKKGEVYIKYTHRIIFACIRLTPSSIFRRLKI
jgi:NAD(P)-dependent dehydrogenase (short-subunit alcohol dehydrogenase family)